MITYLCTPVRKEAEKFEEKTVEVLNRQPARMCVAKFFEVM